MVRECTIRIDVVSHTHMYARARKKGVAFIAFALLLSSCVVAAFGQ